jgi:DNA modification methylase
VTAERCQILGGDCVEEMRKLESGSVQLAVTSPPYDKLRTYGGHPWDFEATARELYRVLCDGGVCCWNVGDSVVNGSETLTSFRQALYFVDQVGFRMHDTMFYEKSNPSNPSDAQGRYNQVIEYVFVFSNGKPRCFNPIKDKPNVSFGEMRFGKKARRDTNGEVSDTYFSDRKPAAEFGLRGNCWRGNTRGQEEPCCGKDHPAMMPRWLAHDLILSWSNAGDTVLDPMAGSGTTGAEAMQLARNVILIEAEASYIPVIRRTMNVTPGLALA